MSITAGWAVIHSDGRYEGVNTTLKTPEDVAAFVDKVAAADPYADSIGMIHNDRPLWDAEQDFTDHDVFAAWRTGSATSATKIGTTPRHSPVGDPESAGREFDDEDFPAGSGLPLNRFTAALVEFLRDQHVQPILTVSCRVSYAIAVGVRTVMLVEVCSRWSCPQDTTTGVTVGHVTSRWGRRLR